MFITGNPSVLTQKTDMSGELESGGVSEKAILQEEAIFRGIRFDLNGLAGA
jgi:hypothetical protein